jgi:thioredoxin-related protein
MPTRRFALVLVLLFAAPLFSQTTFNGGEQWKTALEASDTTTMKALYSNEAKSLKDGGKATDISEEYGFWQKLFAGDATGLQVKTLAEKDQPGVHVVIMLVSMTVKTPKGPRTRYVIEQQGWQLQGPAWRIMVAAHSELMKMPPVEKPNPSLYHKDADAKVEIAEAVASAAKSHKRVVLVFGGNWCYDCHVLDQAFHQADVEPIVSKNYEVVHVDIGDDGKKNGDLADRYKVPLDKGVPALAILGADGALLYSQQNGEWESARSLDPDDVIAFLNKWKP